MADTDDDKHCDKGSVLTIGLISGTSMDGIDACIVKVSCESDQQIKGLHVIGFDTYTYPEGLREALVDLSNHGSVHDICLYNMLLGKLFAEAAKRISAKCQVPLKSIAVIGSHGQTIHHIPNSQSLFGHQVTGSFQIGDPSVIANECGVTTVGDFRVADMSVGGQGAPLIPYLDMILLKKYHQDTERITMFLNIGGISNITVYLPTQDKVIGFDCGPGNMVIDGLMQHFFNEPFDDGGKYAEQGEVCQDLLHQLLKDNFYTKPPPKSTGREAFGTEFLASFLKKATVYSLSSEDCIATATELTAQALCINYNLHIKQLLQRTDNKSRPVLFVSGGGIYNHYLIRRLKDLIVECDIDTTMSLNIDPKAKEAVCFALLAYQTLKGTSTNIPEVTGALRSVVLGKICPAYAMTE